VLGVQMYQVYLTKPTRCERMHHQVEVCYTFYMCTLGTNCTKDTRATTS